MTWCIPLIWKFPLLGWKTLDRRWRNWSPNLDMFLSLWKKAMKSTRYWTRLLYYGWNGCLRSVHPRIIVRHLGTPILKWSVIHGGLPTLGLNVSVHEVTETIVSVITQILSWPGHFFAFSIRANLMKLGSRATFYLIYRIFRTQIDFVWWAPLFFLYMCS